MGADICSAWSTRKENKVDVNNLFADVSSKKEKCIQSHEKAYSEQLFSETW